MKILEIFSDDDGRLSAMRLYSFIALIVAVLLSFKGFLKSATNMEFIYIWVSAAFAPKVVQKLIEKLADKKVNK